MSPNEKISSMYLSYNNDCSTCISKKTLLDSIHANACIRRGKLRKYSCFWYLLKLFKTNSTISIRFSFTGLFSRTSLSGLKPAWKGILGYKSTISAVTGIAFSRRLLAFLIFSRRCPESLMYYLPFCITGFR